MNFSCPYRPLEKIFLKAFLFLVYSLWSIVYCPVTWADRHGGQIVLSTTSDPKSFNDITAKETSTTTVTGLIFEGLVMTDPETLEIKPLLAQSWEVSEDGLIWTFHLRSGVKWNDGVDFTAGDVAFTFNQLIYNPDIPSSAKDIFQIEGKQFLVEKVDDLTVKFTLPAKFAPFLRSMSQSILPKHKLEEAVKSKTFSFTWGIDTPPKEIVGTGAFMLTDYHPGERLVFKRNPYYWKKSKEGEALPYVDQVIYLIVQSTDTSLLKFLDGELDAYPLRGADYPIVKPREEQQHFTIYDLGPDAGTNFIVFNQNTGKNSKTGDSFIPEYKLKWFRNEHFRRAVAFSIDRNKIIEIVMNGFGYPQFSSISPSNVFFYNPNIKTYEYDLNRAKEELALAGFKDRNNDGILEDEENHPLEFTLYTNGGANERIQIAGIMIKDLESLGMKINFKILEFNTLVSKLTSSFDWDAIILGLTGGGIDPHFGYNVWASTGGLHMWFPGQQSQSTEWEKQIDDLFLKGLEELDEKKRKVIYDDFQKIAAEQVPLIYTVLEARLMAVRNKFGNLKPTNYGGVFHNIEEIYIK